ncbi:spore germination protein GerPC [Mesobacillus maritimus]|uniref:spore germination protein GerPC n=1 Tax=Mesobacillus maritimus TaxID=1643336 RepID=UPI0020425C8B|nr:spore germination protein GerPC [Mesobacillus maritimus]MCM3586099.1 spore germination protein GerPC [Mesobacillus maritimus]MCM3667426.1 spore germination protein GerPC [Mesobacillus maritimus]
MNNELYQYLKELHHFVEHQSTKIKTLEKQLAELQKELSTLKERPPVQVGTIEYKFDQLKVETLEGTLNIGLNPSDLEGISDFTVDNKNIQTPVAPKDQFMRSMEIENELREYLEGNLPEVFEKTQQKLQFNVDESYYSFIKEDITKQLSSRIATHLNHLPQESKELTEDMKLDIIEKIKGEIQHGVFLFLNQLKEQG